MTTGSELAVWWRGHRGDLPRDGHWAEIGEDSFREIEHRITGLHRLPGRVPDWAEDLFRVSRAAFLADKYTRRDAARDRWTRSIRLSVPVTAYERWQSTGAGLAALLQLLTADLWEVEFRPLTGHHVQEAMPGPVDARAGEVAVFSGGLDSLSWAAVRAQAESLSPLLLVMFGEGNALAGLQRRVWESVERLPGARALMLLEMSQTPRGDGSGRGLESSSRTRGLLYAAGAVRAAAAHGVDTVHVPENGQLALNPPLTAARSAACSTRSVHPLTLARLNALIGAVAGPRSAVRVVNPWAWKTKGEVCKAGSEAGLSPADLEATLSCGKSPKKWCGGPANCGVCFPCLVRRSGLLHAQDADGTDYRDEPWSTDVSVERRRNWRALQQWLLGSYTFRDVLTDIPLPPDTDPVAAFELIMRGRGELTRLLGMVSGDAAAVA
ncbi:MULTISPECIES: 7-cyano-7-deazaguanine synthase [unclassified Streptomyces]|uniref:7-cyano-7-deazaguanine synthase n=1 Tax=unclassified Streptomyces TaxID=2593676 RepID=UPI002E30B923|nr:7-cyano-7-deazaguanine synthase [Streptomyces sp. NBC_01361]